MWAYTRRFIQITCKDIMLKEFNVFTNPGCRAQEIAFDIGQVLLLLASHQSFSAVLRSLGYVLPDNSLMHCSDNISHCLVTLQTDVSLMKSCHFALYLLTTLTMIQYYTIMHNLFWKNWWAASLVYRMWPKQTLFTRCRCWQDAACKAHHYCCCCSWWCCYNAIYWLIIITN